MFVFGDIGLLFQNAELRSSQIGRQMEKWGKRHGSGDNTEAFLQMDRPKILAMMRLVDEDRNGTMGFEEFKVFAQIAMEEHIIQQAQDDNKSQLAPTEQEQTQGDHQGQLNPMEQTQAQALAQVIEQGQENQTGEVSTDLDGSKIVV
jgi:hypothetical protein